MAKSKLTKNGRELAEALTEVLGDVTGAAALKGRRVNVPDRIDAWRATSPAAVTGASRKQNKDTPEPGTKRLD